MALKAGDKIVVVMASIIGFNIQYLGFCVILWHMILIYYLTAFCGYISRISDILKFKKVDNLLWYG